MSLADKRSSLLEDVEDQLAVIAAGDPVKEVGDVFEQAARDFQAIACCNLLLKADRKGLQKHLFWAGLTQRTFLERSQRQGNVGDFRLARSRWDSMYCAIAAADDRLAGEIHALAPKDWIQDGEYEYDFAYHLFISLVATGGDQPSRATALARFEKALDGSASIRLELCQAIQSASGPLFEDALARLADARVAEVKKERETANDDDAAFEPLASVFVEGLALVRLGAVLGLAPLRDYPLCPAIGWLQPASRRPDDLFAEI